MQKQRLVRMRRRNGEEGFTLLEYAAGAVVLLGGAYFAMNIFSNSLQGYFTSLSTWVQQEGQAVEQIPHGATDQTNGGAGNTGGTTTP